MISMKNWLLIRFEENDVVNDRVDKILDSTSHLQILLELRIKFNNSRMRETICLSGQAA